MSRYASVSSIEVLKDFRASLGNFVQIASGALDETSAEIRRTSTWLSNQQYGHWKKQLQVRSGQFVQAKLALNRKQVFDRAISGSASSCLDEKKALQKAEKRLKEAEHKLSRVKFWSQRIEKQVADYRATVQGLVRAVEVDIPNSRARLDRMIDALDAYIALAPPEMATTESLEATGSMDFVWSDVTRPTSDGKPSHDTEGLKLKGKALRKATPSSKTRSQAKVDSDRAEWVAKVKLSDALRSYVLDCRPVRTKTKPGDRVVLAVPKGKPDTVYLERTTARKGDSGWYIGVGKEKESEGCVAVSIADLIKLCPSLTEVLNLPVGYLVVRSIADGSEAVLNSNGEVKWCTPDSKDSASKG